jgi:hypothetical protein
VVGIIHMLCGVPRLQIKTKIKEIKIEDKNYSVK